MSQWRCIRQQLAQRIQPDQVERLEHDAIEGQRRQGFGNGAERRLFALVDRSRQRVACRFHLGQDAVDDQVLLTQPDGGEFFMGAGDFAQGRLLGARDQDQPGAAAIGQCIDGGLVLLALLFQASQRAETRSVALAFLQESAPCAGQLQQPYRVPRRCGVEDDVVVIPGQRGIGQQCRELVECGDFRGAGPRELFLDALDHRIGQDTAHRPDEAVAIGLCRRLRVDLQRRQPRHVGDRGDAVADGDAEHLPDVGGRVGADQQHILPGLGQTDRGRAGDGSLAHPALAGEEQEARRLFEEFHG